MTCPLVIMDLGDVLVRTTPGAQYAALAQLTGIPAHRWAEAADATGLVAALEDGRIEFQTFAVELFARAATTPQPLPSIEDAWNKLICGLDEEMVTATVPLAHQGRLLFASNTSPPHFARIRSLLTEASIAAPACLSYEVGHRKPVGDFFHALATADPRVRRGAVFIDDRAEHVAAARQHGLIARRHYSPQATAAYLRSPTD